MRLCYLGSGGAPSGHLPCNFAGSAARAAQQATYAHQQQGYEHGAEGDYPHGGYEEHHHPHEPYGYEHHGVHEGYTHEGYHHNGYDEQEMYHAQYVDVVEGHRYHHAAAAVLC